ncbi:MAG TPA: phosphatidate cytidylyltransferase [Steroidobacteraceae bacterium]|nr:phosphatidate cytidylyltransferase [Steroidobacteraceae bacterium]
MLRARVLTALALGAVILLALFAAPPVVTAIVMSLIVLAGAWEWSAFLKGASLPARVAFLLLVLAVALWVQLQIRDPAQFVNLLYVALGGWCLALLWILVAPGSTPRWAALLMGLVALVPTLLTLVRMDAHWSRGAEWTLYVLLLAFAADTGAFFAGRSFGRHKLAPRVSPGKTWEGVIGGVLGVAVVAMAGAWWFGLPSGPLLLLSLVAGLFSVVGDLTESLLKRGAGLKDSGALFPGHGGVLDRIDSVTAAAPVLALGLIRLGVGS